MIEARWLRRFAAAMLTLVTACAGEKDARVDSSAVTTAALSATTAATTPRTFAPDTAPPLLAGFHEIGIIGISSMEADTLIRQRMRDGDGWVFAQSGSWSHDPTAPDLVVRADSALDAPMVAYVDYWPQHDGGWGRIYAVRDSTLKGEMDRLTEDDEGMVALHKRGDWAQVIYGYHDDGKPAVGWVRLVPGKVEFTNEQQQLD